MRIVILLPLFGTYFFPVLWEFNNLFHASKHSCILMSINFFVLLIKKRTFSQFYGIGVRKGGGVGSVFLRLSPCQTERVLNSWQKTILINGIPI